MFKIWFRKLFRWFSERFRPHHAENIGAGTKPGNTAIEVVDSQAATNQKDVQNQDQENKIVRDGLTPQGESAGPAMPFEAADPGDSETLSHVLEKPAAHSWSEYYSEHRDEILEGFRAFFSIGETITGAIPFPGSDIVFGALTSFVERVQIIGENNEMKEKLRSRISHLKFNADAKLWPHESLLALQAFESQIVEQLHPCLKRIDQRGRFTRFFLAEVDKASFEELDACVTKAIQGLSAVLIAGNTTTLGQLTITTVGIEEGVNAIEDGVHVVDEKVDVLSDAQAKLQFQQSLRNVTEKLSELAAYDALRPRPIDTCYGETCNSIQETIKEWATRDDDSGKQVMWLSGLAGTGKSTLAKTIATWADKEKKFLGSSYFFLRGDMKLGKPALVIPTIAYHLSGFDPTLTEHIEKRLEEKNGYILYQEITEQFKKLIEEPLAHNPKQPRKRALLIVDGLDECEDGDKLKVIINLLLSLPSPTNSHIRILLVSRPEKHILEALYNGSKYHPNVDHLAVEHFVERSDIEAYLRHGISEVTKSQNGATSVVWPEEKHFQLLVDSCGKLFVYARTVIGFIDEGIRGLRSREESLGILMSVDREGASDEEPYKNLDSLYRQILLTAVGGEKAKLGSKRVQRLRKVLEAIVSLRDPLGVRSISILLEESEEKQRLEEKHLWNAAKLLSSVLIVPVEEDYKTPIRVFHPSLLDFLSDSGRCIDKRFFVDVSYHVREGFLFRRCLTIIVLKGLSEQVDEHFFQVLEYACVFWGSHLEKASHEDAEVIKELELFIQDHLLKWFRFAGIFLASTDEPLLRCLEVAQNWVSGHNSDILGTLNGMLRSGKVLQGGLVWLPLFTYDAARSKCGSKDTRRGTCHPGTRMAVLDEIKEWATSESTGPRIFWLHGSALTGKSAVAMSIVAWADEKGFLGSGFFFRDIVAFSESSELGAVICTISHDLASFNLAMRGLVVEALEGNIDLQYSDDLELQFDALIAKPLLSLKQDSSANRQVPILLIVDGLDRCEGAAELLALFFTHLSGPDSSHIRILIASRPSPDICDTFEKHKGLHRSISLDAISDGLLRRDVGTYLRDGLAHVHKTLGSSTTPDWPNHTDLNSLVDDSRNSFLYAKYALKFIGNSKAQNPEVQFRNWLAKQFSGESFEDMHSHWVTEFGARPEGLLLVAVAICISEEPLRFASLVELIQTDTETLRTTLPHFYPFIVIDTDDDLRPSHSSLRDFCMNSDSRLVAQQHAKLCCHCLRIMYELTDMFEDPNRMSKKADERNAMFRRALRYACRYWATILSKATVTWQNEYLTDHFYIFIRNRLLSWFYAMGLLQLVSESASMMHAAYKWSQNYQRPTLKGVDALTKEAWHFAEDNQQAFAESPLQVYRAVLDLPEDSKLRRIYKAKAEERLSAFGEANRAGAPDGDISS